mgnify:CR=1 FL=1
MRRIMLACLLIVLAVSLTAQTSYPYFDRLLALPQLYRAYSLRTQAEINRYSTHGLNTWVRYEAGVDAAVVTVPTWNPTSKWWLTQAVTPMTGLRTMVSQTYHSVG